MEIEIEKLKDILNASEFFFTYANCYNDSGFQFCDCNYCKHKEKYEKILLEFANLIDPLKQKG